MPDGYDEKEKVNAVGRPRTHNSIYNTDASSQGRDPLGKVDDSPKPGKSSIQRPNSRSPIVLESTLVNRFKDSRGRRVLLYEEVEPEKTLLDERNILNL